MSQADLAAQQLLTAWLSAGAAIIQAVGAIAAIIVAIYLARSSEARSAAAEAASAKREQQAIAAAAEREAAAAKAAELRMVRAMETEESQLVRAIDLLASEVLAELDGALTLTIGKFANHAGSITGGYKPASGPEVAKLIPEWKLRTRNPRLLVALTNLDRSLRPWEPQRALTGPEYLERFRAYRDDLAAALTAVRECDPLQQPGITDKLE